MQILYLKIPHKCPHIDPRLSIRNPRKINKKNIISLPNNISMPKITMQIAKSTHICDCYKLKITLQHTQTNFFQKLFLMRARFFTFINRKKRLIVSQSFSQRSSIHCLFFKLFHIKFSFSKIMNSRNFFSNSKNLLVTNIPNIKQHAAFKKLLNMKNITIFFKNSNRFYFIYSISILIHRMRMRKTCLDIMDMLKPRRTRTYFSGYIFFSLTNNFVSSRQKSRTKLLYFQDAILQHFFKKTFHQAIIRRLKPHHILALNLQKFSSLLSTIFVSVFFDDNPIGHRLMRDKKHKLVFSNSLKNSSKIFFTSGSYFFVSFNTLDPSQDSKLLQISRLHLCIPSLKKIICHAEIIRICDRLIDTNNSPLNFKLSSIYKVIQNRPCKILHLLKLFYQGNTFYIIFQ